ncbi:MAG TPA: VWA domain-containing protein [Methylibium sp.]|nr:VWA domain-containing protein [Methylibium sp.]
MGLLAANVVEFARVLRRAGLAVAPARVPGALAALECVGIERREDVHAALSATLLERHEQQALFDAAFALYWRDPDLPGRLREHGRPAVDGRHQPPPPQRLAAAFAAPPRARPPLARQALRQDSRLSASERIRLQRADFASMSPEEFTLARRIAEQLPAPMAPVRVRRRDPRATGRIDLRRTLRQMLRQPHTLPLVRSQPRERLPPLVVLLDISGSMERYTRLLLHYVHGLTRRHLRVQTFTFGTELTRITDCLRHRDPDTALARADARVRDWQGGTRIAASLDRFNRDWARRVLGGNATLLLATDGLDGDARGDLATAAAQLRRFAHRVVWLNPLLRFEGFEPQAHGVRTLLRHTDRMLPLHNLDSLADLERSLRELRPAR